MSTDEADLDAYRRTLFPYAAQATDRMRKSGGRFAYYTSAATAMQIFKAREIWMRNALVMNDYMEVEHGVSCVERAYRSTAGEALSAALDGQFPGLASEIESLFAAWVPGFRRDTFVTCLSEHSVDEDQYGRLSMWRAYGGVAGVALILNGDVLFRPSTALEAYSSPVAYLDEREFANELATVAAKISAKPEVLLGLGRDGAKGAVFTMLRFAAVCTKHPAFREEREWRVIASPALAASPLLPMHLETVGGIPQRVLKIKLEDHPDQGLIGLEPAKLLERVLIGPCEHADVIWQALVDAMSGAGVPDAHEKIFDTGIPLRANQR